MRAMVIPTLLYSGSLGFWRWRRRDERIAGRDGSKNLFDDADDPIDRSDRSWITWRREKRRAAGKEQGDRQTKSN